MLKFEEIRLSVIPAGFLLLIAVLASPLVSAQPENDASFQDELKVQTETASDQIHAYLNNIAYEMLNDRASRVARINSKRRADQRQQEVYEKISKLVGGIPKAEGPIIFNKYSQIVEDGFSIENIAYESFPDYWVTANVYVPEGEGPFPAIVIAPGHGAGKSSSYSWGANFAKLGIMVLSIDPMGQGERMQHFDAELGVSKLEGSGEHEHANQSALLIGQHIARYWIADSMRGVDYLIQRSDVDSQHLGTFGCSGGGTAAAYLAAMDPRIQVAAVASFTTSFTALLPGNGPQDAEQTLPGFISEGLDFADWVELAAPKPYAIFAFEDDFFPIAGAISTYEEAKKFYANYDAEDQLEFIHGQGGHCNLGPVTDRLMSFLLGHLKGEVSDITELPRLRVADADSLLVMPTGQVSTSLDSDLVLDLTQKSAKDTMPESVILTTQSELVELRQRVQADIYELTGVVASNEELPSVNRSPYRKSSSIRVEKISVASEPGITFKGYMGFPEQEGPRPVILWMDSTPLERTVASTQFIELVNDGNIVIAFQPRGVLGAPLASDTRLALGQYMPESLRAIVVGKTIVGMRTDDTIRLLNWLLTQENIDSDSITLYGKAGLGMTALHTAALDERISKVIVENSLLTYRTALEAGLHKNLSEQVIPSVLNHYDVVELLQVIFPRKVEIVNAANAMGQRMLINKVKQELSVAIESDEQLGLSGRIEFSRAAFKD